MLEDSASALRELGAKKRCVVNIYFAVVAPVFYSLDMKCFKNLSSPA